MEPILVLILVALLCLVCYTIARSLQAIGRYLAARGAVPDHANPACGKCGYDLAGIESWRCPECGGEFKQVGIVGAGQVTVVDPYLGTNAAAGWTILHLFAWIFGVIVSDGDSSVMGIFTLVSLLTWLAGILGVSVRLSKQRRIRTPPGSQTQPGSPSPDR